MNSNGNSVESAHSAESARQDTLLADSTEAIYKGGAFAVPGQALANGFWSRAWYAHLQSFEGSERRAVTARGLIRRGCVKKLDVFPGRIEADVTSSDGGTVHAVEVLFPEPSEQVREDVGMLLKPSGAFARGVLRGDITEELRQRLLFSDNGLMPRERDMDTRCDCESCGHVCRHCLAALYSVSLILDKHPEALFSMLGVNLPPISGPCAQEASEDDRVVMMRLESEIRELLMLDKEHVAECKAMNPYMPGSGNARQGQDGADGAGEAQSRNEAVECWSGERIRQLRKKLAMTQGEFGHKLNVSTTTVSFWENGLMEINAKFLHQLDVLARKSDKKQGAVEDGAVEDGAVEDGAVEDAAAEAAVPRRPRVWTGRRIAVLRKRLMLTMEALAAKIGVSVGTISNWERNRTRIPKKYEASLEKVESHD